MDVLTSLFAIFCVFLAQPWLIMHYSTQLRRAQGLTCEGKTMLSDLWQIQNRMEGRVKTLGTILDTQTPTWRYKA